MLTNHQMEEYRRSKTLMEFLALPPNVAIYSGYAPFFTEVGTFNTNFTALNALVPNKDVVASGITSNKTTLKRQAANTLAPIMDKTRAYALHYGNATLAAQMNTNASEIFHINDEDFLAYFTSITNNITANALPDPLFAPYNVAAGDLAAVLAIATSFNTLIGQAKNLSSTVAVANTDIDGAIKLLHDSITQFDLLIGHFIITNLDFYEGYQINSAVNNLPIRHSGIEGIITGGATAIPLSGATVKLLNTDKIVPSDITGHYSLIKIKTGNYQFEVSKTGYQTVTGIVHVRRGHIEPLAFQMQPNI